MIWLLACVGEPEALYTLGELKADIEAYEEWAQPVGWGGAAPSCVGAHGPYVEIWYNQLAMEYLVAQSTSLPEGAALVHKAYAEDKTTLLTLTAMRKVDGFAPDHGDWFWGQFDDQNTELQSGDVKECAECHASGQDFIRFVGSTAVSDLSQCP